MPSKPAREKVELTPLVLATLPPGRHLDQDVPGLMLQVPKPKPLKDGITRTRRVWVLRIMYAGKRHDIGIGGYPGVGLSEARSRARDIHTVAWEGRDPLAERRAAKSARAAAKAKAINFRAAAEQYIEDHRAGWRNAKHADQWAATLETYAYPRIGRLDVADIATSHVVDCLKPIWSTKTETATRLRGRIETVIAYADKKADRERLNPARWRGHLDALLPKPSKLSTVEHHASMDYADLPAFIIALQAAEGEGARALLFTILTAARSGEVRGATWGEIDLKARLWTVPKSRMKAGAEHRVPLSQAAVDLLKAQGPGKADELIFPGAKKGKALSDMSLSAVLRRMSLPVTVHGFRSTFRTWAAEKTTFPREIAEQALAHAVGSAVEQAYQRGDAIDKRRKLMDAWAKFATTPPQAPASATVTPISAAKRA